MSNVFPANYGSCINFSVTYPEGVDLTGKTLSAFNCSQPELEHLVITQTGERTATGFLASEHALLLGRGMVNSFQLRLSIPGGCDRTTDLLWIEIV